MPDALEMKLDNLQGARDHIECLEDVAREARAKLEALPEYAAVREADGWVRVAREVASEAEATVRAFALELYVQTGEKKPAAGVTIKMMSRVVYDVERAMEWAKAYAPKLLLLDRKAFEATAKANAGGALYVPGEVLCEPQAYIASDLRAARPGRREDQHEDAG